MTSPSCHQPVTNNRTANSAELTALAGLDQFQSKIRLSMA